MQKIILKLGLFLFALLPLIFLYTPLNGSRANEAFCSSVPRTGIIYVVGVQLEDAQAMKKLQQACFDISNVRDQVAYVYATEKELGKLDEFGFYYEILSQQPSKAWRDEVAGEKVNYHSFSSLTEELQEYALQYPNLLRLVSIGKSVKGRDLWAVKITDNPDVSENEPEFKYVATMHGDEPVGTELCMYFINYLLSSYGKDDGITELINETEIWILPLMNPDGFESHTRYNGAGFDLNRNFPEAYNYEKTLQPETEHVINWSKEHNFVASANFHTGALVVNYPYDYNGSYYGEAPTPDNDLFIYISKIYSSNNPPMWESSSFADGITNGADWYVIQGGMQDWNYRVMKTNEVTLEVSRQKTPPASTLPKLWEDNKISMLEYLKQVHIGIRGVVRDAWSGEPLSATIRVEGIAHEINSDFELGNYHRMLLPGVYALIVSAPGYELYIAEDIEVQEGYTTVYDIDLVPSLSD